MDEKKYISIAKENIFVLRQFLKNAAKNYLNKVRLLEAELHATEGNKAEAILCYQQAIALSSKHGFLLEHALSCERRAIFYLGDNSIESATESFQESFLHYKKWGSERKVKHLSETYPAFAKKNARQLFSRDGVEFGRPVFGFRFYVNIFLGHFNI